MTIDAMARTGAGVTEPAESAGNLLVLYGTETGNCAEIAKMVARDAGAMGLTASLCDMADFDLALLRSATHALVIVSTFGEGDPPQPAWPFFEAIASADAPRLDGLRFSVCALGDSCYEFFCGAGRRLDEHFEKLGAERLLARVDCDIDYEEASDAWRIDALACLTDGARGPLEPRAADTEIVDPGFDKRHMVSAAILRNEPLTGPGSSKHTRHVELSIDGHGLDYEPGDALGVMPRNSPADVAALLAALDLPPEAAVEIDGAAWRLDQALATRFEIQTASPRFLALWAEAAGSAYLEDLQAEEKAHDRVDFVRGHHIADIVRTFKARPIGSGELIAALRPLQPRLYSIASSRLMHPDEVHLTVGIVDYELHGRKRTGVATGQLAFAAPPGSSLPVYLHRSPHFRLAADDLPLILIGAGTGVAPYRGFLQERQARGASGRAVLFLGERNAASDFLYQADWASFARSGQLSGLRTAFSRDTAHKRYVQHRMLECASEIYALLEEGAHLYVCGDAVHMAPDVHEAIVAIVEGGQAGGREAAEDYVRHLIADHRYHRDVY